MAVPLLQAQVWAAGEHKTIRKTFASLAQARRWRQESQVALRQGSLRAPSATTLRQATEAWITAAEAGLVRTRSGDPYKPSAVRAYRQALSHRVLPALGDKRLTALSRLMLQDLAEQLLAQGLSASSIRNTILPLRAIYRRAHQRGQVAHNPTLNLSLPAVRGRRDRIARPQEASALIAPLPPGERAIWATALYAGLRLGELQALDWHDIDLEHNLINVERSWDRTAGPIQPKATPANAAYPSQPSSVPTCKATTASKGQAATDTCSPTKTATAPSTPPPPNQRAQKAWANAGLQPIGLHDCRHSYASYMIAAGINPKALSTYMGHTSITITLDRYGHLLPGNEHEAAHLLHTWLTTNNQTHTP
jgi:integrase